MGEAPAPHRHRDRAGPHSHPYGLFAPFVRCRSVRRVLGVDGKDIALGAVEAGLTGAAIAAAAASGGCVIGSRHIGRRPSAVEPRNDVAVKAGRGRVRLPDRRSIPVRFSDAAANASGVATTKDDIQALDR